jgi:hypothetical protein
MPVAIQGPSGKVNSGTLTLIFIEEWTASVDQDLQTLGPFLNDAGTLYRSRTSNTLKWGFKGAVPSGKDANQTAIITALTGGTDTPITLITNVGYTITVGLALVDSIKLGHSAKGTATFEATGLNNGSYTIA